MFKRIIAIFVSLIAFLAAFFGLKKTEPKLPEVTYVNYAYGSAKRQVLDLELPEEKTGDCGLILFIHGGAWIAGDKDVYRNSLKDLAALGYAAAAINYRYISEQVHMDAVLDDISAALAAIKALTAENGLTVKNALLTGGSAGAHLSLLYAYARANEAPIRPAAVVSYCGPTDLTHPDLIEHSDIGDMNVMLNLLNNIAGVSITEADYRAKSGNYDAWYAALQAASPLSYVTANVAPTVLGHGQQDSVVPYANAVDLDAALSAAGVTHVFVSYPNSGHGLDQDPACAKQMDTLLRQYAATYLG